MKKENDDLKPCPFCGGKAYLHGISGMHTVGCKEYSCRGCFFDGKKYNDKDQAVTAWNRRASDDV